MNTSILAILIILFPILAYGQSNPFDTIQYDRVMAYEFQGEGSRRIEYCLKDEKSRISKSVKLSEAEVTKLEEIFTSNSSYGTTTAACFDPHFAVVYYLNDSIVSSVDVCLECNYLEATVDLPATRLKMIKVTDDYSYPAKGFSVEAWKGIFDFCKRIGFTKYLRPRPFMDN